MRHVARVVVPVLVVLLHACGGDSSGPSGAELPAESVVGTWTVNVQNPACSAIPIQITVAGADSDVQPFGSLSFATIWSAGTAAGTLYGTVNVRTRTMTLRLVSSSGPRAIASVDGTLDESLAFSGRLVDPYGTASPLLGPGPCESVVSGTRTGA